MKIWVIGRGIPTKNNRMMGSFELGQAKLLSDKNDVSYLAQVFTFNPKKGTEGLRFRKEFDENVRTFSRTVPYFPGRFNIHLQAYIYYQWRVFLEKVEENTGMPDIIHIHYPARTGAYEAFKIYKERGVKLVCTEHWTHVLKKQLDSYELDQLIKYVENADAFICVGEPLKQAIYELVNTKRSILVVPNFVEDIFHITDRNHNIEKFEFVTVGRLVKVKQVDKVILAFNDLLKSREDVHLTIIGYGEEYEILQTLTEELNITEFITFTGTLSREEVAERISKANCLVCFSNCETFGVPIIEAWACGLPVISSDALGFSEYWRDDLGFIVEQDNVQLLTKKMDEIISFAPDKEAVHDYAMRNFGEESIKAQIEQIYNNL